MPSADRPAHLAWLTDLTQVPTAAGRESRVVAWIRRWVAEREGLALSEDGAGNLVVSMKDRPGGDAASVYFTAHLDHPAFVVERIVGPGTVEVSFRGGVMDVFFEDGARIRVHSNMRHRSETGATSIGATLVGSGPGVRGVFKSYVAELDDGADASRVAIGDVATWELPAAEVIDGVLHTHACDDLAAAAAALGAMDVLLNKSRLGEPCHPVRLLFTRAEEVGFVGAIAACRAETMPKGSIVIALENSRSFEDSPIGGGPIVRVGDRLSVFTPWLTAACAKRAEEVFGKPAMPTASQVGGAGGWQRKLMPGGACEASVFCAAGYAATCLCLPLGNYHNMARLAELQAGTYDRGALGPPRAAREFISVSDFHGLVDLLAAIGTGLPPPQADAVQGLAEKLWNERGWVLGL